MIKVTIRVEGRAPFSVTVLAESIRDAVDIVRARYPEVEARVAYPIDPEAFFAGEPVAAVGPDDLEDPGEEADPWTSKGRLSVPQKGVDGDPRAARDSVSRPGVEAFNRA
jgi:hypothetical protein